jgi:hypothetical protein
MSSACLRFRVRLEGTRLGLFIQITLYLKTRLGGQHLTSIMNDFLAAVEKRGVGAMEIVAMDMKLRGMYIARQLSFQVYHTSLHLFARVFLVITSHLFLIISSLARLPLFAFEAFRSLFTLLVNSSSDVQFKAVVGAFSCLVPYHVLRE